MEASAEARQGRHAKASPEQKQAKAHENDHAARSLAVLFRLSWTPGRRLGVWLRLCQPPPFAASLARRPPSKQGSICSSVAIIGNQGKNQPQLLLLVVASLALQVGHRGIGTCAFWHKERKKFEDLVAASLALSSSWSLWHWKAHPSPENRLERPGGKHVG